MKLRVVEHVSGVWSYHLAEEGKFRPLCNPESLVMNTSFKLEDWGCKCGNEGIRYKWCKDCEKFLGLAEEEKP